MIFQATPALSVEQARAKATYMQPGRASRTAEIVCIARAVADGLVSGRSSPADKSSVARFSDPTALALLPEDAQALVEVIRADNPPKRLRARVQRAQHVRRSKMMVARTVAIDDAIRDAASPQLVILGAGLDGRAWRMPELRDVVVFEVDHPDSQRDKRARAGALALAAKDVRFVAVDFERDSLDEALAKAGHDTARATTWVWEGVVMYLEPKDVEATLAVIERRSAPRSRLIVAYHSPALVLHLIGWFVRRLGEPLRSSFTPDAMRSLLSKHGFGVVRDDGLPAIGLALSDDIARATKVMKHMRIVTADRSPR
jgi:methyltransferase (TIGR00027 family)